MKSTVTIICSLIITITAASSFALQPFFDQDKATRHAPEDPELTDLDLEILELCGDWGAHVEAVDFENMLLKKDNQDVIKRMRQALGDRIFSRSSDDKQFVHELRRVWFDQQGFQHVFCGEPDRYNLGGFHYAARYWQAQDMGWAGYRKLHKNIHKRPQAKCQKFYLKEKLNPPVFTTSVSYIDPQSGKKQSKCVSGYNRAMHGEAILIAGTRAFKQANRRVGKNSKEACLYESRQESIPRHFSQMVIKQRALRTFFPIADKRPYCKKNKRDYKACLCSNL
ncbi:MAG: EndoU domain-containing protein [Gammaproteobacteria bacterium]|nr:EndoU domain-containing protein [Gammaproteobacteria bacterium]